MPDPAAWLAQPATQWGVFDDGTLVGKAADLHHEQFWGGGVVPASGLAGVAVTPGNRSRGVGRKLVAAVLQGARDRGTGVSTLFGTSNGLYRSLGWETIGSVRHFELPAAELASFEVPDSVTVVPATPDDLADVRQVYERIARRANGMLKSHELVVAGSDDPSEVVSRGITLVRDEAGEGTGYLSWERGRGYGHGVTLTVPDLLATDLDAAHALLAVLGSWKSVTPLIHFRAAPPFTPLAVLMPWEQSCEVAGNTWMHRIVDVQTAMRNRGWPQSTTAKASFRLIDPIVDSNDKDFELTIASGSASLEETSANAPLKLDIRGLTLLWSGIADCTDLRSCGLLEGHDAQSEAELNAIFAHSAPTGLLEYF